MPRPQNPDAAHSAFAGLDLLSSAGVLVDRDFLIRYLNAGAENLFAISQRKLLGKPLSRLLGETHGLDPALRNTLKTHWSYTGQDLRFTRPNADPLHLDCTVSPAEADGVSLLPEFRLIDAQLRVAREEQPIHVAFAAPDRPAIDAFHAAALAAGGTDNGAPGLRPDYHPNYYAAFVLDPDGNNVEAVRHAP